MLKKRLLLIVLVVTGCLNAQTMYWVGGSGYWNDINHWANNSGGTPAGSLPTAFTNVIFDNNSSAENATIHVTQGTELNGFTAINTHFSISLVSGPSVTMKFNGMVDINPNFKYKINGKTVLAATQSYVYNFAHTQFAGELVVNTNHNQELGFIYSNSKVSFQGNFELKKSVIVADDILLSSSIINLNQTLFQARAKFMLENANITGVLNSVNKLILPRSFFRFTTRS